MSPSQKKTQQSKIGCLIAQSTLVINNPALSMEKIAEKIVVFRSKNLLKGGKSSGKQKKNVEKTTQ